MDGQVPSDTDYQGWFSRQSFTRQSQIVGVTRARLIRDGGMSPDDFYNDKGEWLTLEQLRNWMLRRSATPDFKAFKSSIRLPPGGLFIAVIRMVSGATVG